jgi:hypothetical protein
MPREFPGADSNDNANPRALGISGRTYKLRLPSLTNERVVSRRGSGRRNSHSRPQPRQVGGRRRSCSRLRSCAQICAEFNSRSLPTMRSPFAFTAPSVSNLRACIDVFRGEAMATSTPIRWRSFSAMRCAPQGRFRRARTSFETSEKRWRHSSDTRANATARRSRGRNVNARSGSICPSAAPSINDRSLPAHDRGGHRTSSREPAGAHLRSARLARWPHLHLQRQNSPCRRRSRRSRR